MDKSLRSLVLGLPRPAKRAIVMVVDVGLAVFQRLDCLLFAAWLFPAGV